METKLSYSKTSSGTYDVYAPVRGRIIRAEVKVGSVEKTAAGWIGRTKDGKQLGPAHKTRNSIGQALAYEADRAGVL